MLGLVLVATVGWIVFGFDGTVEQLTGGAYGIGIHWSTIQNFTLVFYLSCVNLQVGGLQSITQLRTELSKDLRALIKIRRTKETAEEYSKYASVDPMRGFFYSTMLAIGALFIFEVIWTPLYDYFQFGSWWWPVYSALDPSGNPFLSGMFVRNVGAVIASIVLMWTVLRYVWDTRSDGSTVYVVPRFSFKFRMGIPLFCLVWIATGVWITWIVFPHSATFVLTQNMIISLKPVDPNFLSQALILPSNGLFPQTEYTLYVAQWFMKSYPTSAIFGFYLQNNAIHLVNVITKYLTMLAFSYPFFAIVRTRK